MQLMISKLQVCTIISIYLSNQRNFLLKLALGNAQKNCLVINVNISLQWEFKFINSICSLGSMIA